MTSGDLLADRRLAFGLALRDQGDLDAALSVIVQAVEVAPAWPAARFAQAETLAALGCAADAAEAYRHYLQLDPADTMGASARLALLGHGGTPQRLPDAYVRTLFDQYAQRYEDSLLGNLAYRGPALLRAAVDAVRPPSPKGDAVLDLGCGTGLAGVAFRDRAIWLEGIDLSPKMIAAADRKRVYDRLGVAEIVNFLAAPPRRYDLIVAADTLVYLGDLAPVLGRAAGALEAGGLLAFTLQKAERPPYVLGSDQRYSHAAPYVIEVATEAGFVVDDLRDASYRMERNEPVPGLLGVVRKQAS
jgi:predicted TPR repeat methyltransferase